jgi:hypothetical protein
VNCNFSLLFYKNEKLGLSHLKEEHRLIALEKRVYTTIFGSKRNEVTGDTKRLHKENLYNLYRSTDIIRRACMKTGEVHTRLWWGKLRVKDHLESLDVDWKIVYTTTHCSLKAYCAILVRRSNFRHQTSPRVSSRESTQRRKVEPWMRNVR